MNKDYKKNKIQFMYMYIKKWLCQKWSHIIFKGKGWGSGFIVQCCHRDLVFKWPALWTVRWAWQGWIVHTYLSGVKRRRKVWVFKQSDSVRGGRDTSCVAIAVDGIAVPQIAMLLRNPIKNRLVAFSSSLLLLRRAFVVLACSEHEIVRNK